MTELFHLEVESQTQLLTGSLLALERAPTAAEHLEVCMRAAHSLKGAAGLVGVSPAVAVAHVMEECFVAAQRGAIRLGRTRIDRLLEGVDLLVRTASPAADSARAALQAEADRFADRLAAVLVETPAAAEADPAGAAPVASAADTIAAPPRPVSPTPDATPASLSADPLPSQAAGLSEDRRVLRVTAENFNRLLGLAGESLVQSQRLKPSLGSLLHLKRLHQDGAAMLDRLCDMAAPTADDKGPRHIWEETRAWLADCRETLAAHLTTLEVFDSHATDLARRLYDEALACRMRPFADGIARFPKMVRGVARALDKQARLEVMGEATQVDRDVLQALESPLTHLLRNAVDHGIEMPAARVAAGKPAEGVIRLEASHNAGMLEIVVADDGSGVDPERLRAAIVARSLAQPAVAEALTDAELMEFLFLPGFTLKPAVSEISGRGVGLDAVRSMIKQLHGTVRVTCQPGHGTRFELRLPLTLSVLRMLLADVGGEAYAFPLTQILRAVSLPRQELAFVEGKPHVRLDGRLIGLISAVQVLGGRPPPEQATLPVVLIAAADATYGLIVDRFLGERETVVQPLDSRLGTVADIMAGGLMADGTPVLIVDVADLLRSVEKMITGGTLRMMSQPSAATEERLRKRVLVIDDSLTVRELERKLLDRAGYAVETAVDGMEGWNVARTGRFDLAITDVDMPRMDGVELVRRIKQDPNLASLPVMIVSYKDEETDRRRGLEAGADYYLAKAGFEDETLLRAVRDLIGEPLA